MTQRELNIAKAEANGYVMIKLGKDWYINDNHGDCHGSFPTLLRATNFMAKKGSYYQ